MRILVVSQYFYPEEFKINDLVEDFVKEGHEVIVLTGKPNYPSGKIFKGYKFWGIKKECYKGAKIIRVPLFPRGNGGAFRLIINYLSYVFFAGVYSYWKTFDVDCIFCFETSPITQMYPALWAKKGRKIKTGIWVQDLWPESVSAASSLSSPLILKILSTMVTKIYEKTDVIFIQSPAFEQSITEKGDFKHKLVYAPNWAEDLFTDTEPDYTKYRNLMPDGFKVMFAGNIGVAQDFESIIEAANETKEYPNIKWVIIGDGRYREEAQKKVERSGLKQTVTFLGRFPVESMPHFLCHADALLVSLKDEHIFSLTIPSKTQCYMAVGKPILAMLSGIGGQIIDDSKCGLVCTAGDYKTLATNVIKLYSSSRSDISAMGVKGKEYYDKHFRKEKVVKTILDNLK